MAADKDQILKEAMKLLDEVKSLDDTADEAEQVHSQKIVELATAHETANKINSDAESLLFVEEQAAASAYDAALATSKAKRLTASNEATQLVADAQATEELAASDQEQKRTAVSDKLAELEAKLKELVAA